MTFLSAVHFTYAVPVLPEQSPSIFAIVSVTLVSANTGLKWEPDNLLE
jgi:hypothetical protein